MRSALFFMSCLGVACALGAERTMSEIEKEITELNNEYVQLQKKPIVVWGKKQEGKGLVQKRATSVYNINLAQGSDKKAYKTKTVVSVNPTYICPIHKYEYEGGHCPVGCLGYGSSGVVVRSVKRANNNSRKSNYDLDHCRSEKIFGTSNFCNLGPDYDLSYRSWKLLSDSIPAGEAQEARLKEIESKIDSLKKEKQDLKKARIEEDLQKSQEKSATKNQGQDKLRGKSPVKGKSAKKKSASVVK